MSDILMVICALLGVIGLIFLTYYATKWLNKKFRSTGWNGAQNGIKIIECMGIAQDKQLLVVKVGRKTMLLGVTPNSVSRLADLDEDDIAAMTADAPMGGGSFMESLKSVISGKNNAHSGGEKDVSEREDGYRSDENSDF
ncbi:MAG: flagellar biosynthetic protein FliO [Oscillospiraceae bacterium]|nr:flagellar biosynthetic protein FliO [Oscillospiraceae bacterium]